MELDEMSIDEIFSGSDSTLEDDTKRTRDFDICWDKALEIPTKLKSGLRKHRLHLSQNDFYALEYQLYSSGCLETKHNDIYTYGARTIDIQNNDVYVKLIHYLDVWKAMHLLIWRYKNQTTSFPTDNLSILFETAYDLQEDERTETKERQLKLNDNYTLRRIKWSNRQLTAATNTRNFYLKGFEKQTPMLSDLEFTVSNNDMIHTFLKGLLRGSVNIKTMHDICCAQLQYVPLLEKTIEEASVQMSSSSADDEEKTGDMIHTFLKGLLKANVDPKTMHDITFRCWRKRSKRQACTCRLVPQTTRRRRLKLESKLSKNRWRMKWKRYRRPIQLLL